MTEKNYLTVNQTSEKYPAFTQSSLRYILFHKEKNNFDSCVRKIGRKILISEPDFLQWIENQK